MDKVKVVSDISCKEGVYTYCFKILQEGSSVTYCGKFNIPPKNNAVAEMVSLSLGVRLAASLGGVRHVIAYTDLLGLTSAEYGLDKKKVAMWKDFIHKIYGEHGVQVNLHSIHYATQRDIKEYNKCHRRALHKVRELTTV